MSDNKENLEQNGSASTNANQDVQKDNIEIKQNDAKSVQEIKAEVQSKISAFGATSSEDINKNVGSFSTMNKNFNQDVKSLMSDLEVKKVEKKVNKKLDANQPNPDQEKINFDKFTRSEQEGRSKNKLFQRFGVYLRSKKGFKTIISIEAVIFGLLIIVGGTFAGLFDPLLWYTGDGPLNAKICENCLWASSIMIYLAMSLYIIPLIYLLSAYFVGINQVWSSRGFHIFLMTVSIVVALIFITAMVCGLIPYIEHLTFMSK